MNKLSCALASGTIVCAVLWGCSNPAEPRASTLSQDSPPRPSRVARIPLSGGPLGVAVSAGGITYVTRDQANSVARLEQFANDFSDTIPVGAVPSFIAFDPGGTKAYVANQFSDNIGIIDATTNAQTDVIPVHGDPLPVAVTADGSTLFTTTNVNRLYKIDLATKAVVDSLDLPATSHHLLVSGDVLYVATRDGGSVLEVDWHAMTVRRTFVLGGRPQGMAIAPDRHELYVANEFSNVLHVVDLASGAIVANVPLASGGEGLALGADGRSLFVGLVFAGAVQVIDRSTRAAITTLQTGGVPREIVLDPARQRVIVANEAGWVDVLGPATPGPDTSTVQRVALSGGPLGVAVSGSGVTYVTRDQANSVARLDRLGTAFSDTIPVGVVPAYISFDPAGAKAYVANLFSQNIGIIDVATNTQTDVIPVNGDPLPVAVAPDGSTLFTTTDANRLYKIDLGTRTVVDSLDLPATSHHLLAHPNDSLLYVATRDGGSVLEVRWRTMTVLRTFVLGGRPQGMAISPDGRELYVANELSNVLHIVDLSSGTTAANVPLASGGEGLALSPDGSSLYVGLVFAGAVQVIDRSGRTVVTTISTGGVPREIATDFGRRRVVVANEAGWVDIIGR